MIIFGIDLDKIDTIGMLENLEREIDKQEIVLINHVMRAIACCERDLKNDYIYYSSSCRFESPEVHQQLLKNLSNIHLYLIKHCEEKCEEIEMMFFYSFPADIERRVYEYKKEFYNYNGERYDSIRKKIDIILYHYRTIEKYYKKYAEKQGKYLLSKK